MYNITVSSCAGGFLDRSPPLLSPPPPDSLTDSTEARLNASSPPRGGKRLFRENDEGNKEILHSASCKTFVTNFSMKMLEGRKCLTINEVL
jgi:hypothetical protein